MILHPPGVANAHLGNKTKVFLRLHSRVLIRGRLILRSESSKTENWEIVTTTKICPRPLKREREMSEGFIDFVSFAQATRGTM